MKQAEVRELTTDPKSMICDQLARLCELENEILAIEARASEARRLVEERFRPELERLQHEYLELEAATLRLAEENKDGLITSRRRSCEFPHGRVGFRMIPLRYETVDPEKLLTWAKKFELVRIIIRPDITAVKKYARENNIVPKGMVTVPAHDQAYISLNSIRLE